MTELDEYCAWKEPHVRRLEPPNADDRAAECGVESQPSLLKNFLYNESARLQA